MFTNYPLIVLVDGRMGPFNSLLRQTSGDEKGGRDKS